MVVVDRAVGDRFLLLLVAVDGMEEGLVEGRNRYRHVADETEVDLVVKRTSTAPSSSYLTKIDGCCCCCCCCCCCRWRCCSRKHVVSLPQWNTLDAGRHCRGMMY